MSEEVVQMAMGYRCQKCGKIVTNKTVGDFDEYNFNQMLSNKPICRECKNKKEESKWQTKK